MEIVCTFGVLVTWYTGTPHFLVYGFIARHRYCNLFFIFIFTNWVFMITLHWTNLLVPFSKSIFSLHISVSHFQTFSLLLYLLRWSVMSDFWLCIVIVLRHDKPHPYETVNILSRALCVLTVPLTGRSHCSLACSLSLGLPIPETPQYWN